MKVVHWTSHKGSGLNSVAEEMVMAERKLGLNSFPVSPQSDNLEITLDADIHVSHTLPPVTLNGKSYQRQCTKPYKEVGVFHGTPDHIFAGAVHAGERGAYAPSNSLMLLQYNLKRNDAVVTFWARHKAIYETMVPRSTKIDLVPMGVDKAFWAAGESRGKYQGAPSVWTGENAHEIKWPLDLLLAWPWIAGTELLEGVEPVDEAYLHCCYLPFDQHRYWFPLVSMNGAYFRSHPGAWTYPHSELRNIFKSVDFITSLVQKGDVNRLCSEASATGGGKIISYVGNPLADYWVREGDQRDLAVQLSAILRGQVEPRADKAAVPDSSEMALAMLDIYERVLNKGPKVWAVGKASDELKIDGELYPGKIIPVQVGAE